MLESNSLIPSPDMSDHYSDQFKLRIPKDLHRDLAIEARRQGVSMNQLVLYHASSGLGKDLAKK